MAHKRELAMRSTHSRIHIHMFLRAGSVVVVVKKVAKLPKARKKKHLANQCEDTLQIIQ